MRSKQEWDIKRGSHMKILRSENGGAGMSVLIKGMKMPKTCEDCSFYGVDVENGCFVEKCYVLRRVGQDKPSWCPLGRVVMCKDCKYRELETFHGKQRYVCQMDSADPYDMSKEADNDEWFCADGEEKQ